MTEFRPGGFSILPPVIKNLLIINTLIFVAQYFYEQQGNPAITDLFALHDISSVYFKPWQIITYMFLHGGWAHIFFNMFALWMFGSTLENVWGSWRFFIFYMLCGIGAAALHLAILHYENSAFLEQIHSGVFLSDEQLKEGYIQLNQATLGASGAIFGCLAAFGYLFPNDYIYLYAFLPIKAKWFVIGYAAVELFTGVQNSAGDNVAHWAHLGGGVVGLLIVWIWNKTNRRRFY